MKKYDIVYFLKETYENEELRYSLRSVEKNFPHNKVWFYGGRPDNLEPDERVRVEQNHKTKWLNVRMMLEMACKNDEITEDFWLFNDDFFVLQPVQELQPLYDGDLPNRIKDIEGRHGNKPSAYTNGLRQAMKMLEGRKLGVLNYAVHMPMLINRKKALEVLAEFPDCAMFRALYGNYCKVGGIDHKDTKIASMEREVDPGLDFLSTSDLSFIAGKAGEYVRETFKEKCKFEK